MKKHVLSFLLIVIFLGSRAQNIVSQDSLKIDSVYNVHLNILVNYLKDRKSDPSLRRSKSIRFMETLTSISSDDPGGYIGKTRFTQKNLNAWKLWFLENRKLLRWDDSLKIVVLDK